MKRSQIVAMALLSALATAVLAQTSSRPPTYMRSDGVTSEAEGIFIVPSIGVPTDFSPSGGLGTTPQTVIPAGRYRWMQVQNVSVDQTVACRIGAADPALNTSGSYLMGPGQSMTFQNSFVPGADLRCVGSTPGVAFTAEAF